MNCYLQETDQYLLLHRWGVSCVLMEPESNAGYPMRNDILWKGVIEEISDDFLRFFFPDAETIFDLERGFEFLDKELEQLFEPENEQFAPRHVDKLIKVYTRDGEPMCILLHCEVQGYKQREFPERMFRYYARIWDKYPYPLAAIAILTDNDQGFRPDQYKQSFLGTNLCYHFNTYKVLDQSEAELEKSENPFAMVILTVQAMLKMKAGFDNQKLFKLKVDLARRLLTKRIPKGKQRALMNFLRFYLRFSDGAMNQKFENLLTDITGRTNTMGIEELLLAQARKEGELRGELRGEERGLQQGIEQEKQTFVHTLIKETTFGDRKIASLAGVALDLVKETRAKLDLDTV